MPLGGPRFERRAKPKKVITEDDIQLNPLANQRAAASTANAGGFCCYARKTKTSRRRLHRPRKRRYQLRSLLA
jgi:hypothetical protein